MKVLMVCFGVTGKGTYWRALQLARGLAQRGHSITLMSTRADFSPARDRPRRIKTSPDSQAGVTLVEAPVGLGGPLRAGWDPLNVLARLRWGRDQHFDLVHAFESRPAVIYPALAWQRRGAKLIMDWCDWFGQGGSVEERPNPVIRALLRPVETHYEDHFRTRAAGTTVINSVLRQRAIELGVPPHTIFDLPNGSDVDQLKPLSQAEARQALNWPLDVPVIGYIGAIFERDATLMAQAFDRVVAQEPRARLLLAGYCNIAIEQRVSRPDAIIRTSHLDVAEINRYLAACDVCWLPLCDSGANRGRFPLKINDFIAVGKPVVATAVGAVSELVRRGDFGVVCGDDPAELAQCVVGLLREPERAAALGRHGRELAERELQWTQIAQRLAVFYQQV